MFFLVNDLRLGIISRFNMGIQVQSSLIEPLLPETDFFLHAKVIFRDGMDLRSVC